MKPILTSGMAVVTIKVPKKIIAHHRTLKDIEELAMDGFEECHKKFIRLHAESGSIIISWVFPKGLSSRLEQLARDNAAVFEDNEVVEVTVGGRRVFPCTQQEVRISSSKCAVLLRYVSLMFAAGYNSFTRSVSAGTCNCIIVAKA